MIRVASLALFAAAVAVLAQRPARAELPVAPMPREVRPDGSRDPVPPPPEAAKAEDPAAVVDRIIKNSQDVGDKLARTDTSGDTQKKQDTILKDIDALINRQENPPPPQSGDDKDKDENQDNKDDKDKDKQNGPKNMDMGDAGKQNGMPMGGMDEQQPKGGSGRRPRTGDPMGGQAQQQPEPQPDPMSKDKQGGEPKEDKSSKKPVGGAPGANTGDKGVPKSVLPFEEDVARDVWGHLPDRLRRQMTQYYKEDVMPKYSELLRLYYSSLSDKTTSPAMPRK